jgi:hypothetical protein
MPQLGNPVGAERGDRKDHDDHHAKRSERLAATEGQRRSGTNE